MAGITIELMTDDADLGEICEQYWLRGNNGKFVYNTKEIAEAYEVPRHKLGALVNEGCQALTNARTCQCGAWYPINSRTQYQELDRWQWRDRDWICQSCKAASQREAQRAVEAQDALRKRLLLDDLTTIRERQPIDLEPLSFRETLFLVALLRSRGSEDLQVILPPTEIDNTLTPTAWLDRKLIGTLRDARRLCFHPCCQDDEEIVIKDDRIEAYYPGRVYWRLPLSEDGLSAAQFLDKCESALTSDDWSEDWRTEAQELHREVALSECVKYLQLSMAKHQFDFTIGEKTIVVLKAALQYYSIAQMYNFICRAAKDAAAYSCREDIHPKRAANTVPGCIQRYYERALAERWDVKAYRRDFEAPESCLSHVLFNTALRLPDGGFNVIPPSPAKSGVEIEAMPTTPTKEITRTSPTAQRPP